MNQNSLCTKTVYSRSLELPSIKLMIYQDKALCVKRTG